MKRNFKSLFISSLGFLCCLTWMLTGCESLQRKFTRKPKQALPRPSPIIVFQDYTRTMTPLDRYRKHYMMFDYWNDELIESFQSRPLNAKRYKHASSEALTELRELQKLLVDELGTRLTPFIEERAAIHHQLQSPGFSASQVNEVWRQLEVQTRAIQRDYSWRDVQDQLKSHAAVAQ